MVTRRGRWIPDRGDLVWLSFTPQAGHERPALVLSPKAYNGKVGLVLVCPITSKTKGYPFEVSLPDDLSVAGVVLADQVRTLDWRARSAFRADRAPSTVVDEVIAKLDVLLR